MTATPKSQDLQLAFDVGHSSIGWAVLQIESPKNNPNLLGTGTVIFEADDCLASKRRGYRRQRRHARSTRQRIARMEKLLAHLGVLSAADLKAKHRQAGGDPAPWLLAARVLAPKDGTQLPPLTWIQLWDVLRWYAHNRGYDGNRRWSSDAMLDSDEAAPVSDEEKEDTEKVNNAIALMKEHGTHTMAETFARTLGLDIHGPKKSSRIRFKAKNAAFPREGVEREVRRILEAHRGKLPRLDEDFIRLLLARELTKSDREQLALADIKLPARYKGGLLFGQLVPRFDNRIISKCPISGEKVPMRNCREFFRYRWAMQLANIRVASTADNPLRPLTPDERKTLDGKMRAAGYLTKNDLRDTVRALPGVSRDNLDALLMHPDAEKALLLDPVLAAINRAREGFLKKLWPLLSPRVQKRARDAWERGKTLAISDLRAIVEKLGEPAAPFDETLASILDAANTRKRKKDTALTREKLLAEKTTLKKESGRAAYARSLLVRAAEEVMQGKHPKEEGGCLYLGEQIRRAQINRAIEEQTNNHLVRHRLLILERLLRDLIADPQFAAGDRTRIARLTIEVNRDLREMSGKTAKEIEKDLGLRLSNHGKVVEYLEAKFKEQEKPVEITAGLIRKARVASDLEWNCPYTGQKFEPINLVTRRVDKDHIIPYSQRPSNSLDSLVVTFSEINKWKGARTAWQFVEEEQGKPVPGIPNLSIRSLTEYKQWVEGLESFKGHDDDKRRKKNRKALLLLPSYEEKAKTFLPGDLTATSQLVRLGAQILAKNFSGLPKQPPVISIPGAITGEVRKSWNLLGCLLLAAPDIREADGSLKIKSDIRDITHLHHALDACVLAYASILIPRDGGLWELMLKRNPNQAETDQLIATNCFERDAQGRPRLRELRNDYKEQIRHRLAEKRVAQHVPKDMGGMRAEENTRGVERVEDERVYLRQQSRDQKTGAISIKKTNELVTKVVGLVPQKGEGKLRPMKGVRVITGNFGMAILDYVAEGEEKFAIIPWHKVWWRLGELTKRNAGKPPRLLRNGMLIRVPKGGYAGIWKIFSAKNNAAGMALDIGWPDVIRLKNKTPGHKINVSLKTLLRDGLEILDTKLTGFPVVQPLPAK